MKASLYVIASILIFLNCSFFNNYKITKLKESNITLQSDTDNDDLVIDKIYNLKEVQAKDRYLRKIKGKNAGVSIMIIDRPTSHHSNYLIQAGYNNSLRFETYYNFQIENKFVRSRDFIKHVKILDDDGDYILLLAYRKKH